MHSLRGARCCGRRVVFWTLALGPLGFLCASSVALAPAVSRVAAQRSDPVQDCFHTAHSLQLGARGAAMLCRSARSPGPVLCFKAGQERTSLTDPQLFALCRCALSDSPVDCYDQARRDTRLAYPELLRRCSAIAVDSLSANCRPSGD